VIQHNPALADLRHDLPGLSLRRRITAAINCTDGLEAQALATWFAIGTEKITCSEFAPVCASASTRHTISDMPQQDRHSATTGLRPMNKPLARRLQRLDHFLSRLDAGGDTMLLTELDGFVAGVVVCPDLIMPGEWLEVVWGEDGPGFESERQAQEILGLIMEHYNQVLRQLARPGRYQPILSQDIDGSVLWELWASGFHKAVRLRPGSWAAFSEMDNRNVSRALVSLIRIAEIADGDGESSSDLDKFLEDRAPDLIGTSLETLHQARLDLQACNVGPVRSTPKSVGRNDPCPCGSGKKFKKCCLH
jgi:uncharacterized protein